MSFECTNTLNVMLSGNAQGVIYKSSETGFCGYVLNNIL